MTDKNNNTASTIVQAKIQAKNIKKTMKLQTVGASLNELAKINGYKNWHAFRAVLVNDEPVKGKTLYTMNVNEQAFRAAGIIMNVKVDRVNDFITWFNANFSSGTRNSSFFGNNKDIVELLDNDFPNPMAILYAYVAFNGIQFMDTIINKGDLKLDDLSFDEFLLEYVIDLSSDDLDLTLSSDYFITLNDQARIDFSSITAAFTSKGAAE